MKGDEKPSRDVRAMKEMTSLARRMEL